MQEYILMKKGQVGETPIEPFGFKDHGSEPDPPGPITAVPLGKASVGALMKCATAGVKIAVPIPR